MKRLYIILLAVGQLACMSSMSQSSWPRSIIGADGGILYIYQPQADSFEGNILRFKAPLVYVEKGKDTPRYGSFQALAMVDIDKDIRQVSVLLANVLILAMSGPPDSAKLDYWKETLECGIPGAAIDIPLDELVSALHLQPDPDDRRLALQYRHDPPRIIFATRPSVLVLIDGAPVLRRHPVWGVNRVVNTPNTILGSDDGWFYLYGGHHWYLGPESGGPFNYTGYIAPDIQRVQPYLREGEPAGFSHTDTLREGAGMVMDIIVSRPPAELIQTRGAPIFRRIEKTALQYVDNTNNDIFLDTAGRRYYLLLSGRWFTASSLEGPWKFIPADALPADFAKIPEGSPKDNVLASVAGTDAAREAIVDALLPQTAVILRTAKGPAVTYVGSPWFVEIPGTSLQYAENTSYVVLKKAREYYVVEKGVWFRSLTPTGPWTACTERPEEVRKIPPSCPVYFCKYVYIFGSTPNYIHTGYTSGYLNAFVDGPTLIYGTGYSYAAWFDDAWYSRPSTWGYGMSYNPWVGWCLGADLDPCWFNGTVGVRDEKAGWWGPSGYRPPYIWHHFSGHGLYEKDVTRAENISYSNNIYSMRTDRITRPEPDPFYTDTVGDVFMRRQTSGWLHYEQGQWRRIPSSPQATVLDTLEMQRKRGEMRIRNFIRQKG